MYRYRNTNVYVKTDRVYQSQVNNQPAWRRVCVIQSADRRGICNGT